MPPRTFLLFYIGRGTMGWFGTVIDKDFQYSDEKALIRDSLTWTSGDFVASIEQLSKVGSEWYAAIKFTPREDIGLFEDHNYYVSDIIDGSITWAAIIGVRRSSDGGVCDVVGCDGAPYVLGVVLCSILWYMFCAVVLMGFWCWRSCMRYVMLFIF